MSHATSSSNSIIWPPTDLLNSIQVFDKPCKYIISKKKLGDGTFSTVHECKDKITGQHYAAKMYSKKLVYGLESMLQNEFSVLKRISKGHHNILSLVDYFETEDSLFLITDLAVGGELYDRIVNKTHLDDSEVRELTKTLVTAIDYLHTNNIVHRDIKAENILIQGNNSKNFAKSLLLVDFGFARKLDNNRIHELAGTLSYMAPEYFNKVKGHGKEVDVWAIGVLVYFMLCGYMPFDCETDDQTKHAIQKADYSYSPPSYWSHVSDEAKDFIDACFVVDPNERPSPKELLKLPFLDYKSKASLSRNLSSTSLILDGVSRKLNMQLLHSQPQLPLGSFQSSHTSLSVLSNGRTLTTMSSKSSFLGRSSGNSLIEETMALRGAKCEPPDLVSRFTSPIASALASKQTSVSDFSAFLEGTRATQFEYVEDVARDTDNVKFYL
ncbi:kinase-like domain-containing protein [Scheffersomyces coipomensis]|uniref:kinase-like domain-containing protein n=1 Tax=Scheffersomyces coipomensis TaxID=1788519 RepID=UPI00315D3708